MKIETFSIQGPLAFKPARITDHRGWFSELWSKRALADAGLNIEFVQENMSVSKTVDTLRGLHCQVPPFAQGKLITVLKGAVLDIAVDARSGSATYGRHVSCRLDEDDPTQLWIPPGFLHGFVTLQPDTQLLYMITAPYSRDHERSVAWNDPDLAIDWGVSNPVMSARDAAAPRMHEVGDLFPQDGEAIKASHQS